MEPTWQSDCGTVRLWLGDSLEILPTLPQASVDAVVTDPPYSSGGAFRGDRTATAISKYVQSDTMHQYRDFTGDNRDQRAFLVWCSLWMTAAHTVTRPGGVLCAFSDWRQVPTMTDAVQCGGWVWRNLGTWWKPGCRMQRGRFSGSAEYVVYATHGPHDADGEDSPQNVFSCATIPTAEREHIAQKPVEVCCWVLGLSRAGATALDPFMGSGAVGLGCIQRHRQFWGIEKNPLDFWNAQQRLEDELRRVAFLEPKPQAESNQQPLMF